MEDKKNIFVKPEAEIVEFKDEDIITTSIWGDGGNNNNEYWGS